MNKITMNLSIIKDNSPEEMDSNESFAALQNGNGGRNNGDRNANLDDSDFTVDSHTSGPMPETGWFGGIGTDFLHCLTDNVSPMVSGVATLVHKTAVAVANEISELEREGELLAAAALEEANRDSRRSSADACQSSSFDCEERRTDYLTLPWEVCREGEDGNIPVYFTDTELMKQIFHLSNHDSTFLEPFSEDSTEADELTKQPSHWSTFAIDEPRVKLIHRILDIDENLSVAHSKMSGDPNYSELHFWKNYFFHCERARSDEFCKRKKDIEKTTVQVQPSTEVVAAQCDHYLPTDQSATTKTSKHCDDDESLVPVGSDTESEQDDNLSFVIPSAPNTGDTCATSRSIDEDLVLVDTYEKLCQIDSSNRKL